MSNRVTFPLQSVITMHKDCSITTEQVSYITGEITKEFVEATVELMGGTVQKFVRTFDVEHID